jgi:succinoglycan biosynthesis protein ExoM
VASVPHISVCICTFRRPKLLARLLGELDRQESRNAFRFSVVIADNDAAGTARETAARFSAASTLGVAYCIEPVQNIAMVRNRAVSQAEGDYIAFVDDDEYPAPDWLHHLLATCTKSGAAGVLGPVLPSFDRPPPSWAVKGRFFERPTHPTGHRIGLKEARTGNLLFKRSIIGEEEPFNPAFGTGGEDTEFFKTMMARGHEFVWCNEAPVYETVPPERCTRAYLLRRALLRGSISSRLSPGFGRLLKSLVAIPVYGLSVPLSIAAGEHHSLKYLIRLCDHAGLLLGSLGIEPVKERDL